MKSGLFAHSSLILIIYIVCSLINAGWDNLMYEDIINSAAKEYRINPNLIRAIIKVESNWNPKAFRKEPQINDTSWGLMQVLLSTGRRISNNSSLTSEQLIQPTVNILIGTKFLRELYDRYPNNLDDVIASYNAGSAIRSKINPRFYVNQEYVDKVRRALAWEQRGFIAPLSLALIGGVVFLTRGRG